MSGGRLVVLDQAGRDTKSFPLAEGLATLGSDQACDIRILLPTVSPHHATVVVHANQTVVRNVCSDETLVNGRGVSVAALCHGDVIGIGGRFLRWEYAEPAARRAQAPEPALYVSRRKGRGLRRGSGPARASARDPHVQFALEMSHRASMPGSVGGKQVAIVQPQRRDTSEPIDRTPLPASKRPRASKSDLDTSASDAEQEKTKRKSTPRVSPKSPKSAKSPKSPKSPLPNLQTTTKATLWIESRKTSPRKSNKVQTPTPQQVLRARRISASAKKSTPLRLTVLKRAQSAQKMRVTKIEGPLTVDHTKQAAIRLMTGHTPKSKPSSPSFVVKKPSPVRRTPRSRNSRATPGNSRATPGNSRGTPDNSRATPGNRRATLGNSRATPGNRRATLGNSRATPGNRRATLGNSRATPDNSPATSGNSRATPDNSRATPDNSRATPDNSRATPGNRRATLGNSRATPGNSPATPGNSRATLGNSRATPGNSPATPGNSRATPGNSHEGPGNARNRRSGADRTVSILEITNSEAPSTSLRNSTASRRSGQKSPKKSFGSNSPRKSALKDPSAKRGARKTESIKFDLSNLENYSQDADVLMLSDTTGLSHAADSAEDDDVTLRYSESLAQSPSPRRSIHSRSSRMLQQSLGASASVVSVASAVSATSASPPARSPRSKRSSRGSLIVQKALDDSHTSCSRRSSRSADNSHAATVASAFRTRTLSPRTSQNDLESYSIVDLVSINTDESALSSSVYGTAGSTASTAFGTPKNGTRRKTSSTIDATLLGSSTPYVKGRPSTLRSRPDPSPHTASNTSMNGTQSTVRSSRSTSKSLSTPENTEDAKKHISVNSTRISRASRSRSRLNDSELLPQDEEDDSPRTSKRISSSSKSGRLSAQTAGNDTEVTPTQSPAQDDGTCTPENTHSPEDASTPVLNIQSLLNSSQSSLASQRSTRKGRPSFNTNRKTRTKVGAKSKTLSFNARQTRLRLSSESVEIVNKNDDSEIVTPKSAVKLVPEGVKNKHSSAKKPQSKRSIIDDLNESDTVKQLFSSPVKRKLSQSMNEFSRKQLFEDDEFVRSKRASRHAALTGCTTDTSLQDHAESYTPEIFVSPISTPTRSPSLECVKLTFAKTTPENDRNVRGAKNLLRTPRTRRSIKNDLTNVSGVKNLFAKSPKNRLSDVRVKEVFASSPKNDLRRVTGVKSLFRTTNRKSPRNELDDVRGVKSLFRTTNKKSPRNELDDVRGVKKLFNTRSPANDLRNVSGVKRTLRRQSPRNDLSDVRGVKRVFRRDKRNDLSDVSGVEELFNLSNYSSATVSTRAESLFDQLAGKPQIKATYSKTFSTKTVPKTQGPRAKSLQASVDLTTAIENNWLEQELNKRLQIKNYLDSLKSANTSKASRSKASKSKSLHASLGEVTDVDALLEQELNKEQQINKYLESMRSVNESKVNQSKVNKSKANRSRVNKSKAHTSKANMSRELQKLITDTVEGGAPLRSSRVRNSSTIRNESDVDRKKSASELYSAHSLPIKKRSLVVALEQTLLPLKKRAVMHSTPVKGRLHVTMNASGLARVSPIRAPADDMRYQHGTGTTSSQPKETTEVTSKSTRGTRAITENLETANGSEFEKPSPKKTRGQVVSPKVKPASPAKENAAAKAKTAFSANAKKASPVKAEKASPVKAKKASPVKAEKVSHATAKEASPAKTKMASPAKAKKSSPAKVKKASPAKANEASPTKSKISSPVKKLVSPVPAKTVRSRKKDVSTLESNTIKRRSTLVIAKKSLVRSPKPRATRKRQESETPSTPKPSPKKTRGTRKNTSVKNDKPKTPKNTRVKVQKATVVVSKLSPQLKPRARRGQADQTEQEVWPRATRNRKEPETPSTPKPSTKKTHATRKDTPVKKNKPKTPKNTRAKVQKVPVVVSKPSPQLKPRARGQADQTEQEVWPRATRKRKEPETPSTPEPSTKKTRATRGNTPVKGNKPKTSKNTRTKVQKATVVVSKPSPQLKPRAKRGQADQTEQEVWPTATRKRKEPETPSTPKQSTKKIRGTRKNTPVKENKPKTPKNARAKVQKATVVVSKPSPQMKPRARRGQADQTEQEATSKTRKTVTVQDKQPESAKKSQAQSKSSSKTRTAEVQPKTRGRKTVVSESINDAEVETIKAKADEPANKKTRSNRQEKSIEEVKPVGNRGKKVEPQESVETVPSRRGRRAAHAYTQTRKRKSQSAPDHEMSPKVRKPNEVAKTGRKRVTVEDAETKNTRKKAAVKEGQAEEVIEASVKTTRGRKMVEVEATPVKATKQTEPKTRGRKANIENVPVNQTTGKRKGAAAAESSPVKARQTRAIRGNTQPEVKPAGRSRRR